MPRGTLQTEFVHKPFAELRRLGLTRDSEARVRATYPQQTGLLVVEQVIPESPASSKLEPGDVLVEVDGKLIAEFVPLAAVLDGAVGREVTVVVERGGQRLEHRVMVDDLHGITPDEYIEYGDGVFHNLSYQQARHFYRPAAGVYVANPGYVFGKAAIPRGSIVTGIGSESLANLDDLQRVIESLPDDAQVPVRFVTFDEPTTERQRLIMNDRSWFPAQRCRRDDALGVWPCQALAPSPPREPVEPSEGTTFPRQGERHVQAVTPSLVLVNFDMPYTVSGVADRYYYGTGLIADAERGLVVVDRNTVPVAMGDVRLTFAGSLEIPGRVEYIHPLHNLAVVSYDPKLIGDTPVKSATFLNRDDLAGRRRRRRGVEPGLSDDVAVERGRERVRRDVPAVAHAALPRYELGHRDARQRPVGFRRHARRLAGPRARHVGELRVSIGPRSHAGESRHPVRRHHRHGRQTARQRVAALARGRMGADAARDRAQGQPVRGLGAALRIPQPRRSARC